MQSFCRDVLHHVPNVANPAEVVEAHSLAGHAFFPMGFPLSPPLLASPQSSTVSGSFGHDHFLLMKLTLSAPLLLASPQSSIAWIRYVFGFDRLSMIGLLAHPAILVAVVVHACPTIQAFHPICEDNARFESLDKKTFPLSIQLVLVSPQGFAL